MRNALIEKKQKTGEVFGLRADGEGNALCSTKLGEGCPNEAGNGRGLVIRDEKGFHFAPLCEGCSSTVDAIRAELEVKVKEAEEAKQPRWVVGGLKERVKLLTAMTKEEAEARIAKILENARPERPARTAAPAVAKAEGVETATVAAPRPARPVVDSEAAKAAREQKAQVFRALIETVKDGSIALAPNGDECGSSHDKCERTAQGHVLNRKAEVVAVCGRLKAAILQARADVEKDEQRKLPFVFSTRVAAEAEAQKRAERKAEKDAEFGELVSAWKDGTVAFKAPGTTGCQVEHGDCRRPVGVYLVRDDGSIGALCAFAATAYKQSQAKLGPIFTDRAEAEKRAAGSGLRGVFTHAMETGEPLPTTVGEGKAIAWIVPREKGGYGLVSLSSDALGAYKSLGQRKEVGRDKDTGDPITRVMYPYGRFFLSEEEALEQKEKLEARAAERSGGGGGGSGGGEERRAAKPRNDRDEVASDEGEQVGAKSKRKGKKQHRRDDDRPAQSVIEEHGAPAVDEETRAVLARVGGGAVSTSLAEKLAGLLPTS